MNNLLSICCFFAIAFFVEIPLNAQCKNWINSPQKDDAEAAHSIYRQALKMGDQALAYEQWKIAYDIAPTADGNRDFHFTDGIKLFKEKLKNDEANKEAHMQKILELYNQCSVCYLQKAIKLRNCNSEDCYKSKAGYVLGRAAFDMYYEFRSPYEDIYEMLKRSVELSDLNSEYIVLNPFIDILVYLFTNEKIDKLEVRKHHGKLVEIAEYNIANNATYSQYYDQAKQAMDQSFSRIESHVYDCEYFKEKLLPQYEADPENGELVRDIFNKLLQQGCDKEDPIMLELKEKYEKYATEVNAKLKEEFLKNNPAAHAKQLYDAGDYNTAITKFKEAIEIEENDTLKADYYFSLASIEGRKLNRYESARANARRAVQLKSNWGQPYMLIGDLYAKTSRNCGDAWTQRLAILAAIDKYAYARSIDPTSAQEANKRIARYSDSKPDKGEGHMRGFHEGQKMKVGCWIGETVSLRFSN